MSSPIPPTSADTVRISARRFEQSPYFDFYAGPKTVLGVAAGRYYESSNGTDPVETYWNLRRKSVLYDVPEKPWQIEGPDAVPFLERIFTRPVGNLPAGRGRYAIACTPGGGTFMDGILFRINENRFWYVQPDGDLEAWLIAHSGGFDITISDPNSRVLQIQGPKSMRVMADATSGAIDESMKYFDSGFYEIGGQELYVSRTGWTGELGYEIYSEGGKTDHERLWNDLMEAGSPHGMVYGSMVSMGMRRIEAGILDNLSDFDISMTPFQAGLGAFIDLDKEGFIGREALLEKDPSVLLFGLRCGTAKPDKGGKILEATMTVGQVTAASWSPTLHCGIGYARFDDSRNWIGRTLAVETVEGGTAPCEIVGLPFYDSSKRIPREVEKPIP
ncbi:MAG: aminomethyltransferase family protein [Gammaproteobacteria bacterium]|nr:aminomethyltransferase family protein [Gammaproteobacteria bacterium]